MYDSLIKHNKDRVELDFYATEPRAIKELLKVEKFQPTIYEPACGQGHIAKILEENGYKVVATDICDRGYGKANIDFFDIKRNNLDIVTNPPYFCAENFLEHALKISKNGLKIAMLFRLAFLEGQRRYELFKKYPPKVIYVFSKRTNCAKNGDFKKYKSSGIAFAWFVWVTGWQGITEVRWIK